MINYFLKTTAAYRENDRPLFDIDILYTKRCLSHGFPGNIVHHHQFVYILFIVFLIICTNIQFIFIKTNDQAAFSC